LLFEIIIEIIIVIIVFFFGLYGYRTGIVLAVLNPVRKLLQVILSIMLCIPFGEMICAWLILPFMTNRFNSGAVLPISRAVSVALAFILLMVIGGVLLSAIRDVLSSVFNVGFIGKVNHIFGLMVFSMLGLISSWLFCQIFDRISSVISSDFSGGRMFQLFISINPFN
jgi:hypothetical protein